MKIPDITTITTEEEARQLAIDWQYWQAAQSPSINEALEWYNFFKELADKFSLTDEFEENGVL